MTEMTKTATLPVGINTFMQKVTSEAPEIFDSLDSLKVASTTLLPPFKRKMTAEEDEILP